MTLSVLAAMVPVNTALVTGKALYGFSVHSAARLVHAVEKAVETASVPVMAANSVLAVKLPQGVSRAAPRAQTELAGHPVPTVLTVVSQAQDCPAEHSACPEEGLFAVAQR